MVARLEAGSIAVFPPPHSFFFARQLEINLGFVYYKQNEDGCIALGVRHSEQSEYYETLSSKRSWACYNAPPGTMQRMATYFYLSSGDFEASYAGTMAYTRGDCFKRLDGYKTMTNHFHMAFSEIWANSKYFMGMGFRYMPADLSFKRLGDGRNFSTLDDMNNWSDHAKYIMGEVDTYKKTYEYDLYGDFNINYVKLPTMPTVDDCSQLVSAIKNGEMFVTTGEVLIKRYAVEGGSVGSIIVDLEWTFPMEFCEAVYSDGENIGHNIVDMSDRAPFGEETISIGFPGGMKWVRFTALDCAMNGAFTQPVFL